MRLSRLWAPLLLAALALALPARAATPIATTGAWLDHAEAHHPDPNWNKPNAAVPRAPKRSDDDGLEQTSATIRPAAFPEDRAVKAAGWLLVGAAQTFGPLTLIFGCQGFDGMQRPEGTQAFVFVGGRFAGTLSPKPMGARTDGQIGDIQVWDLDNISADYVRYTPSDALCCPSRESYAGFKVVKRNGAPVVVLDSVYTQDTPH